MIANMKAQLTRWGALTKRPYSVHIHLMGDWFLPDGTPRERNTDNAVKVLLDCLAEAAGFGRRGRGDQWLDRDLRVTCAQHGTEAARITLTPA